MTSSIKLAAIDVDGTLVTPQKTITQENRDGVAAYVKAGGTVLLASGRMHSSIRPFAVDLQLPPDNTILSYNGAMARTIAGDLLFERPVPNDLADEIVDMCRERRLHLNYYYDDELYVAELNGCSDLYQERSGSKSVPVGDLRTLAGKPPTKLLIIGEVPGIDILAEEMIARYAGVLHVTKTDDEYLEFMAEGVDKSTGLAWVCDRLGVAREETIAFGDSYNDVQMLAWAGVGVAMSTGREAAIGAAKTVADNDRWTGVGDTLASLNKTV